MANQFNADRSLVTAARNLILGQSAFLRSDNATQNMNINGNAAGSITAIWNGTGLDDTGGDWTRSGIGSQTFASKKNGTYGLDTGVASLNDTIAFTDSSDSNIASSYSQISFWLQPKAYPKGSDLQIKWQTVAGVDEGLMLKIASYMKSFDLDKWQKVTIPISDFQLIENVGKLVLTFVGAANQDFWFDDFELTASDGGGPYIFEIEPPVGEKWHVSMIVLIVVAPSTGWTADKFGNISGGLTNGLLLRQRHPLTSTVIWSLNSLDNVDLFGRFHPQDDVIFSDGNMLIGFMIKPSKASIVIDDCCLLEFVVRDDLSSLEDVRAFVHYGVEDVEL